ncbi:SEL1-like repeat protein [Acetobacter fallax]|uniref:Sel1 repeat family protein n=1 Tax=Acetobacter fallax TaxID=1737473 RepID=A0ABX0KB92_9PROT|nr:tetratricopeptide repeat protein [Acetobacter fallax]NHO32466.1 hypothetical protein [Acetobacter fallax]NHO36026.1 hypothetical protein [Acetobacter fallax]
MILEYFEDITEKTRRYLSSPEKTFHKSIERLEAGDLQNQIKAVRSLSHLAENGDYKAAFQVGLCYLKGQGVPGCRRQAIIWLEQAAHAGLTEAMTLMAFLCLAGLPDMEHAGIFNSDHLPENTLVSRPDIDTAFSWAERAAKAGSADAHAILGQILSSGPPHYRNPGLAETHYRHARDGRSRRGMLGLGIFLLRNAAQKPDALKEAVRILEEASDAGMSFASWLLGGLYEMGQGVSRDLGKAFLHYEIAANSGQRQAQTRTGIFLLEGKGGKSDLTAGETWLRKAALTGDAEAACRLAVLHSTSDGAGPNMIEAASWCKRAIELGHSGAALLLADWCSSGRYHEGTEDQGTEWLFIALDMGEITAIARIGEIVRNPVIAASFRKTGLAKLEHRSRNGDALSAWQLALCLMTSPKVEADKVVSLLMQAAEGGIVDAQAKLGEIFVNGHYVTRNIRKAITFLRSAGESGHLGSTLLLTVLFEGGHGINKNINESKYWLKKAIFIKRNIMSAQPVEEPCV